MSEMIADLLHSLAHDSDDADGVAQLVVTAIGSCGQHYVCWKTNSGEFKQQSNDLPKALQEWLFPADGSTRDFETLQVVLSGDDTFWASDRDGEVRSEQPSSQQQRLRRALTVGGDSVSPTGRRRGSRARELAERGIGGFIGDAERPRASTAPSASPPAAAATGERPHPTLRTTGSLLRSAADQHQVVSPSHSRSASVDKLRRVALVPLAVSQQRRSWATRPRSMVYGAGVYHHEDLGVLREQPSSHRPDLPPPKSAAAALPPGYPQHRPRASNTPPRDDDRCTCTCPHHHGPAPSAAPPARSSYADASVQTDPTPEDDGGDDEYAAPRRRQRHQRHSTASSTGSVDSFRSSTFNSQRASFETTTTRPDDAHVYAKGDPDAAYYEGGWGWAHPQHMQFQPPPPPPPQEVWVLPPNPIIMGRMQDYFRSSAYVLGGALS
ncbi:hypothetical protein GGS23DRAFT_598617 [Durotheca rogersii]|uniref:uncharacterized protein n=1 Tax=Durotheca rogersii TaxID=419775 RepID=UPI00221E4370|nr:uncharacterized protein GGS23DRAFT_598617 [Durotheca rogersii]KAI5861465.1 hypothetical protein GGS23DRAFT_598617 [Durotheca rogersii]